MTRRNTRPQWKPIAAVTACATLFTTVQGLSYPLLTLVMLRHGMREEIIGLNGAMMPLGMIAAAPVASALICRIGALALAVGSILGGIASLLLIGAIQQPWAWMPLRFLLGLQLASLFVATETWVNVLSAPHVRGRVLGMYSMVTSVGLALGPIVLLTVGTEGWIPFLAAAGCGLFSLLPLLVIRVNLPSFEAHTSTSVLKFISAAPVLLGGAAVATLADQVGMSMLPVFTVRSGMTELSGNLSLAVMLAGSILLQYPAGWLADRVPQRALYISCALLTAITSALMPIAVKVPMAFWILMFIWGGAYYSIYTLSLVLLGQRFEGSALIAGNAAFAAMWGVGGLVGMPLAGFAMQVSGSIGLPVLLVILFGLLTVGVLIAPAEGTVRSPSVGFEVERRGGDTG